MGKRSTQAPGYESLTRKSKAQKDQRREEVLQRNCMMIRYLIDENLEPLYKAQLLIKKPDLMVYSLGDPGTPSKGTLDPEILCWCEENDFILITNNRKSMPAHLVVHLSQGSHIPGIITLNSEMSVGGTIEELILIAEEGNPIEYQDRIVYLPVT